MGFQLGMNICLLVQQTAIFNFLEKIFEQVWQVTCVKIVSMALDTIIVPQGEATNDGTVRKTSHDLYLCALAASKLQKLKIT